jgi:SNF family Na+-dependent transporter
MRLKLNFLMNPILVLCFILLTILILKNGEYWSRLNKYMQTTLKSLLKLNGYFQFMGDPFFFQAKVKSVKFLLVIKYKQNDRKLQYITES